MAKLIRITTIPVSMQVLLKGQVRFMKQQGMDVTMISSDGPEVKALIEQEECMHITVPFTRKISPFTDIKCLLQLTRILKKIKPDIVHTHTPKAGLIGMWAAYFAGVPVRLHTIAGLPWMETKGLMRLLLKSVEKITAMPAHHIFPNSFRQQEFLQQQKIAVKKMKVLGHGSSNGIDTNYFSLTDDLKKEADSLLKNERVDEHAWVWIFVGRLVKDKGIGELLEAFEKLHEKFPNDKLWLLGEEEPTLDPLDEYHARILKTHPAIRCWGFIKDIRPYLAAAKVLVFPSYREGFPNVPLQAGAMGCMLLLSDINGCNEIVDDGINGSLVPAKDTELLINAMLNMRNSPLKREEFANAIRNKIMTNYQQQNLWKLILEEYKYWLMKKGKAVTSLS